MRPTSFVRALPLLAFALAAPRLGAHPGHSLSEGNWSHLLTSPDHLFALGLLGGLLVVAGAFARQERVRKAIRITGAALIVGALAVWGIAS